MSEPTKALGAALAAGYAAGMAGVKKDAVAKSSGPYSLTQLAAMDHPYARRHGKAQLPPQIINKQTDGPEGFAGSWETELGGNPANPTGQLVNRNPVADYLIHGTRYMLERPIDHAVEDDAPAIIESAVRAELEKFYGQDFHIT